MSNKKEDSLQTFGEFQDWWEGLSDHKKDWIDAMYKWRLSFCEATSLEKRGNSIAPFKVLIYRDYRELKARDDYTREQAFNEIIGRLDKMKVDPATLDIDRYDYLNFDRAFRRWLRRQHKKGT